MSDVMRWLICLFIGHVRTDWAPVVDICGTRSWDPGWDEPHWTANMPSEARFCLRCHVGYERRFTHAGARLHPSGPETL